jgi:hypothetical protein
MKRSVRYIIPMVLGMAAMVLATRKLGKPITGDDLMIIVITLSLALVFTVTMLGEAERRIAKLEEQAKAGDAPMAN